MAPKRESRLTPNEQRLRRNALERIRRRRAQGRRADLPEQGKQGAFQKPKPSEVPQRLPSEGKVGKNVRQSLRFAMRNVNVLDITYRRTTDPKGRVTRRNIEPYSFRRGPGGLALMGYDQRKRMIRRFIVNRITFLRITRTRDGNVKTFKPRWPVEV